MALGVVEIGRDRDDGLGNLLAEAHLGVGLELGQNHRGDLGRTELLGLAVDLDFDVRVPVGPFDDLVRHSLALFLDLGEFASHEALDRINRVPGVRDRLALGGVADHPLAALGKSDDRRRGAPTFGVLEHHRLSALHDGHAGVGGAQINANYFCHKICWI